MEGGAIWEKKPSEKIWWLNNKAERVGELVFRFDNEPEKEYYLYRDYSTLSPERKAVFDKENPFWADFFSPNKKNK